MSKFIMMFRGGTVPEEKYPEHMQAWTEWFETLAATGKITEPGAPLGQSKTIVAGGEVRDYDWKKDSNVNGYCIVEVGSIEEAVELTKGCPALEPEFIDGTVEVRELSSMQ